MEKENSYLLNKEIVKYFPKVELHRHLEGTFDIYTLFLISQQNKLDTPDNFEDFKNHVQFPQNSQPDFLLFLSKFKNDWYRSLDDVYTITYNSVINFADDGMFYIELRFSPEHFAFYNNFDRKDVTKLIVQAGNKAAKEKKVKIKYLLTFNRSKQNEDEMIELYNEIKNLNLDDIVGIDLAGDELNFPAQNFVNYFERIRSDGIYKSTIHAGEVTPAETIWDAINLLHADRIGHGTSTIKDTKLQSFLRDNNIVLEQCITSNYQTGSWVDEENHPMGELHKKGVPVTINSDDPFIQNSDLTDDYVKTVKYFGFNLSDLYILNKRAIDTSFISDSDKKVLLDEYKKLVANFKKTYLE
jgi:adenosine deaminase